MHTPLEIDFQEMESTPALKSTIASHVMELEHRYGRVTACRVVLKAPSGRHHIGGLYEVNIHLSLPQGREVNVKRTAQLDGRRSNVIFALDDAFKRARRRLQDQVRRLQGH